MNQINEKMTVQTRKARDWRCGEHRPPGRRLGGRSQTSIRPCKLSDTFYIPFFFLSIYYSDSVLFL